MVCVQPPTSVHVTLVTKATLVRRWTAALPVLMAMGTVLDLTDVPVSLAGMELTVALVRTLYISCFMMCLICIRFGKLPGRPYKRPGLLCFQHTFRVGFH